MNLTHVLFHAIQHYGASISLINGDTVRLQHSDQLPQHLIDLTRQYKPQIVRYIQYKSIHDLLEDIRQDGADIQLIDDQTLRLHHADRLPENKLIKIKQFKAEIINILRMQTSLERATLCKYLQHEAIQAYFDRLEQHRNNLRKNKHSPNNAMVKPKHLIQDLMAKFILSHDQAQQLIDELLKQDIFHYDSNYKFYLFPNHKHAALDPFKCYAPDILTV